MLRKSLKPGFSFENTFSISSFFESLNNETKKYMKISLKMSNKHLLGDLRFFVKKVKI